MRGNTVLTNCRRILAISDIHIDYKENLSLLSGSGAGEYGQEDALIVAGDVTDDLERLELFLSELAARFRCVFYVPGNHELWVHKEPELNSVEKFEAIIALCERCGVFTGPQKLAMGVNSLWVVPLFSWYEGPEDGASSLFLKKPVVDRTSQIWADFSRTRWPRMSGSIADYFLSLNQERLDKAYDLPVISFSHFLPVQSLMFSENREQNREASPVRDLHPEFNFSRVAGTAKLQAQIMRLGSRVHVYGHQHRNRCRVIQGVRYVSHCMGYPKERRGGYLPRGSDRPRVIWNGADGCMV